MCSSLVMNCSIGLVPVSMVIGRVDLWWFVLSMFSLVEQIHDRLVLEEQSGKGSRSVCNTEIILIHVQWNIWEEDSLGSISNGSNSPWIQRTVFFVLFFGLCPSSLKGLVLPYCLPLKFLAIYANFIIKTGCCGYNYALLRCARS